MQSVLDTLWVEKYRPKQISEVALPPSLQQNVTKWLEIRQIPHILFYGPAGSGKTTVALILVNKLASKEDQLIINGSYYRGINDVRDQILPFVRQSPLSIESSHRIVFIDEADSITGDAWKALRHIIEQYSQYARFILTCNYITKIPDPIQSRMQMFEFKEYPKDVCFEIITNILLLEGVRYKDEQVQIVIDKLYPDLRKIINTLQSLVVSQQGEKYLDISQLESVIPAEDRIVQLFSEYLSGSIDRRKFLKGVEDIVKTRWLDYSGLYKAIFDKIPETNLKLRVLCNEYAYKHIHVISEDMNFLAFVYEVSSSIPTVNKNITHM